MPPRKIKCSFDDCKAAAQRISGDCAFCNGHYCNAHRLLEDHRCRNLDDCKKEAFDQNLMQLNKERTQVIRGV